MDNIGDRIKQKRSRPIFCSFLFASSLFTKNGMAHKRNAAGNVKSCTRPAELREPNVNSATGYDKTTSLDRHSKSLPTSNLTTNTKESINVPNAAKGTTNCAKLKWIL